MQVEKSKDQLCGSKPKYLKTLKKSAVENEIKMWKTSREKIHKAQMNTPGEESLKTRKKGKAKLAIGN